MVDETAAVVGLVHDGSLYAMRGTRTPGDSACAIGAQAVLRWEENTALAALLRERLRMQDGEPLHCFGPSPLLFGSSITLTIPKREEGQVLIRDTREILRSAQWRAADVVRDETAAFFGCALEDVESYGVTVEHWRETADDVAATLFHVCTPRWDARKDVGISAHLPSATEQVLPLLLAERVGGNKQSEAILHTEDDLTVLTVRRDGVLRHARSLQFGLKMVRERVGSAFDCSPREADLLLRLLAARKVSAENQRPLLRILRSLLPLWAGMFEVFGNSIPPAERPQRLVVTGLYPSLVAKVFCRPQILARCMQPPARVETLPDFIGDTSGISSMLVAALQQATRPALFPPRAPRRVAVGLLVRA